MTTTDQQIADLAYPSHRIVTRASMQAAGITNRMIHRRHERGFLLEIHPGVFSVLRAPETLSERAAAAVLAVGASAASHSTAIGLNDMPDPRPVTLEISAPKGASRDLDGVVVHETRWLPESDVQIVEGIPTTTIARTICDLAWTTTPVRLSWLTQRLIADDRLDPHDLLACATAFAKRGRAGTVKLRALLDQVAVGEIVAASVLERAFIELERSNELPIFTRQFKPPWYDGVRGIVDFCRVPERVIVEVDGRPWHMIHQAIETDRRRDRRAFRQRYLVLRFGYGEVVHRPAEVIEEIEFHLVDRAPGADRSAA